jgi:DNA polymerase-3 subunit epsilon
MTNSLEQLSFVVVDCETTGVSPTSDRILQLAAVVINCHGEVINTFDTIVKPENPSDYVHGAEHIHGISSAHVQNGMPLSLALENLIAIADGHIFTAHNAPFDLGFIHAESERVGLAHRFDSYIDTLTLSRRLDADKARRHTLDALCDHYGITRDRAHEALSDASATATLLTHLLREMSVTSADQLSELLA